jgi:hypothetical protein
MLSIRKQYICKYGSLLYVLVALNLTINSYDIRTDPELIHTVLTANTDAVCNTTKAVTA